MQHACSLPIKRSLHRPKVNLGTLHLVDLLSILGFFMAFWNRHFSHRSVAVLYISCPECSSHWRKLATMSPGGEKLPVLEKAKKIEATGINSSIVATVPNLFEGQLWRCTTA